MHCIEMYCIENCLIKKFELFSKLYLFFSHRIMRAMRNMKKQQNTSKFHCDLFPSNNLFLTFLFLFEQNKITFFSRSGRLFKCFFFEM